MMTQVSVSVKSFSVLGRTARQSFLPVANLASPEPAKNRLLGLSTLSAAGKSQVFISCTPLGPFKVHVVLLIRAKVESTCRHFLSPSFIDRHVDLRLGKGRHENRSRDSMTKQLQCNVQSEWKKQSPLLNFGPNSL